MSPSLASSEGHGGQSNTVSPSDAQQPHHPPDALSMRRFESVPDAPLAPSCDTAMCTVPPLPAHWSRLAEQLHALAASRAGGRTAPSVRASSTNLAVPAQAYRPAGSPFDLLPSPPVHSHCDPGIPNKRPSTHAAFLLTGSRAVKVRKHPNATFLSLCSVFDFLDDTNQSDHPCLASSVSLWALRDLSAVDEVWAVFSSHHDACRLLSLSLPSFAVFPALEADLEPFEKLRRVDVSPRFPSLPVIRPEGKTHRLRMSISTPDLHNHIRVGLHPKPDSHAPPVAQADKFVISSNPPNPRTTFRAGDWICNSVTCAAHNFGRNLACRGCGCPRPESQASAMSRPALGIPSARLPTSPRFASASGTLPFYTGPSIPNPPHHPTVLHVPRQSPAVQPVTGPKPASPSHPLLTPSGRSFSIGGKVQNISTDPSMPCIMYWPDNEPFPEQGQIRPSNLVGMPQPPILNTGNRGPIEHQPGDWICQKCNYLNWRRRKVCQTCYPYAEGNGDSISAAVQTERINLLTSLLAQNQLPLRTTPSSVDGPRRNTPVQMQRDPPSSLGRAQLDIRSVPQYPDAQFIYETSGPHAHSLPLFPSTRELEDALSASAPAPLLPSFLQDIVRSPTLSPTSTSSADLSVEEYEDLTPPPMPGRDRVAARDDAASNLPFGNIWRMNDEETTSIAGIALPHHEDLVGSRKDSLEILRRQSP